MAKAAKVEEKKPARTNRKVSRQEKIGRRLNGISAKTPFKLQNAVFTVQAVTKIPVSMQGFIVKRGENSVAFRHKKSNASKRMVVTMFPNSEILELFGNEGEVAEITVLREQPVRQAQGTVKDTGNSVIVTTPSGEVVTFYRSAGVTVNVFAEDEEGSATSTRGRKPAAAKADAKVTSIADAKKKKRTKRDADDDYDGDL